MYQSPKSEPIGLNAAFDAQGREAVKRFPVGNQGH